MRIETNDEYGQHIGESIHKHENHDVIECEICGFKHIIPLPTRKEFERLYHEEYYQEEQQGEIEVPTEDLEWYQTEYGIRLSLIEQFIGGPGYVFDVGTGAGIFLNVAKQRGWKIAGIEPSPLVNNTEYSKPLNITQGFFPQDCTYEDETFDFVHLSLVLEHVIEPHKVVAQAKKLLKPNGYLTISVPNDFNIMQETVKDITGKNKWWVAPHHHLNYFNFSSLENLLEREGFTIADRSTNFPMEMFILMGDNYTDNPDLGKECHAKRKRLDIELFKKNEATLRELYRSFAQNNIGRCAIVTGQKK